MKKEKFIRRFRKRYLLRFHMSLILTATCLSGALFSKLLLLLPVRDPLIRYPFTACLAYLLLFLFIKLWLWYVSTTARQKAADTGNTLLETAGDVPTDILFDLPRTPVAAAEAFAGGGGDFGGGGASGSFGEAVEGVKEAAGEAGSRSARRSADWSPKSTRSWHSPC